MIINSKSKIISVWWWAQGYDGGPTPENKPVIFYTHILHNFITNSFVTFDSCRITAKPLTLDVLASVEKIH